MAYRAAMGPRTGPKVHSLYSIAGQDERPGKALCAETIGFRLHAAVRCGVDQGSRLEWQCRYVTRLWLTSG